MREETILSYQNLVYKILSHYRILYNYNRDFEEDYFHDGMVALIQAYDTYNDDIGVNFITYASRCIHNKYKDIFKKKTFNEEPLDLKIKDDLYLMDVIPSREEKLLDMLIRKETKEELEYLLYNLSNEDNFIICSLYGIKTKKITQKNIAKILNCTQSCIAKRHNKILNLIKENLKYYNQILFYA